MCESAPGPGACNMCYRCSIVDAAPQANFRFLVSDSVDLRRYAGDADLMLDWDDVLQVRSIPEQKHSQDDHPHSRVILTYGNSLTCLMRRPTSSTHPMSQSESASVQSHGARSDDMMPIQLSDGHTLTRA